MTQMGQSVSIGIPSRKLKDILDGCPELMDLRKKGIIQAINIMAANNNATQIEVKYIPHQTSEDTHI